MSKHWTPAKKTVQLHAPARPSRIRRDPVHEKTPGGLGANAWWESREWEIRLAVAGILFFAVAISAVVLDIGELLGH